MPSATTGRECTTGSSKKVLTTPKKSSQNASLIAEIPAILDACSKTGVATLKFGDFEVSFLPQETPSVYTPWSSSQVDQPTHEFPPASPDSEQSRIETVDKELLEDMRRSQMMIDDPLSFEQEVIDEHVRRVMHDR